MEKLTTVGVIAEKLGCPIWQVQYLLQSRGIRPIQRAGHLRVFSPEVVDTLQKELGEMNQKKEKRKCTG